MDEIQKGSSREITDAESDVRRRLESSAQPFYLSLSNQLRSEIVEGNWPSGTQLPTIDQLSDRYGVAKVTVRQALGVLASEGLIERVQGKGTFVADGIKKPKIIQLESSWQSLLQMLEGNVPKLLEMKPVCDLPAQAAGAGNAAGPYRSMRRVHYSEGRPYCVLDVFLAKRCLRKMKQSFRILTADLEISRYLDLPLNAPIGEVRRVITNQNDEILYLGVTRYRGDLVVFNMTIEVPPTT